MSWLFSRVLVEAYSEEDFSGGEQFALWNSTPFVPGNSSKDRIRAFLRPFRYGMTFKRLTADRGEDVLTLFLADFPVRIYPWPARGGGSITAPDPAYGAKWHALFARYDHVSYSWKIPQLSLFEDSTVFSGTWPRSGTMLNGMCFRRPTLAPTMNERESGYWPTPTSDGYKSDGQLSQLRLKLQVWEQYDQMTNRAAKSKKNRYWPTPRVNGQEGYETRARRKGHRTAMSYLESAVEFYEMLWPTPTVSGNYNRKGASTTSNDGLATAVRKFPTPLASDADKWNLMTASERRVKGQIVRLANAISTEEFRVGGTLNPTWVEWLMGWPLGWTALEPLETDRFQEWLHLHSQHLDDGSNC